MWARGKNRIAQTSKLFLVMASALIGAALLAAVLYFFSSHLPLYVRVPLYVAAIALGLLFAVASAIALHRYISPTTPSDKKEYVQLLGLAIGGILGAVGVYFAWAELQEARERSRTTQETAQQTLENAREVEQNRASETALQSYLQHMQTLIASHYLAAPGGPGDDVLAVAQAQTVSVFNGIRPEHKVRPLLFLNAAGLLAERQLAERQNGSSSYGLSNGRISLRDVNLSEIQLDNAEMPDADLQEAILTSAHFRYADLTNANLIQTPLEGADLTGASLFGADLHRAELNGAQLDGANLYCADLTRADLTGATLSGAILLNTDLSLAEIDVEPSQLKEQLQLTIGNDKTKLPRRMDDKPPAWEEPVYEQVRLLEERGVSSIDVRSLNEKWDEVLEREGLAPGEFEPNKEIEEVEPEELEICRRS